MEFETTKESKRHGITPQFFTSGLTITLMHISPPGVIDTIVTNDTVKVDERHNVIFRNKLGRETPITDLYRS